MYVLTNNSNVTLSIVTSAKDFLIGHSLVRGIK